MRNEKLWEKHLQIIWKISYQNIMGNKISNYYNYKGVIFIFIHSDCRQ